MKTSLAALAIVALAATPAFALAASEEATVSADTTIVVAEDQTEALHAELLDLKKKEQETTGTFAKFILRLKIRQLENQLNVKKALQ